MQHLAISMLFGISLCSLTVAAFPGARLPQNPTQNPAKDPEKKDVHEKTFSGQVGQWWVSSPGRVHFQLLGSGRDIKDGKQPDLWFETPADKDINTLFENLVLDVVQHAATKGLVLSVDAKTSAVDVKSHSGDDGSSLDKAIDVLRVGFGGS